MKTIEFYKTKVIKSYICTQTPYFSNLVNKAF